MSTEELIVVTNVGLILVSLGGIGASIFANDRLADITRAAIAKVFPNVVPPVEKSAHGKHEAP
jgi:thiamine phosphate synthase YjbQ (UPF0047 family)